MKVRICFVSNSSSSSFVVNDFDKQKFVEALEEFVKILNYDEADEYYETDPESLKECILKKINLPKEEQEDLIHCYVYNKFSWMFYNVFNSFIEYRNHILSECGNCADYKKTFDEQKGHCKNCYNRYMYNQYLEYKESYEDDMSDFKMFDFREDIEAIERFVNKADTEVQYNNPVVKMSFKERHKMEDDLAEKYFKKWKELYPNAKVFSFASDEGDATEAFMRCNIWEMVDFMTNKGIKGFKGENS